MYQRMLIQNHAYANKSRRTYICYVRQLLNPHLISLTLSFQNEREKFIDNIEEHIDNLTADVEILRNKLESTYRL